jgi:hypothetical protein
MAPTKTKRPTERLSDLDKAPRIKKMREQGKPWAEIADKLKMTAGRAQFILLASEVKPKDRIKFDGDDDLAQKIVAARDDDGLSWPLISARSGVTEGRVKDIYRRVKAGRPLDGRRSAGEKPARKTTKKTTTAKRSASARGKKRTATAKADSGARTKPRRSARRKKATANPS